MTENKEQKKKVKKPLYRTVLLESSISDRISKTTLETYLSIYKKDEVTKVVIADISRILPSLELKEAKTILSDIIKLIDYDN